MIKHILDQTNPQKTECGRLLRSLGAAEHRVTRIGDSDCDLCLSNLTKKTLATINQLAEARRKAGAR